MTKAGRREADVRARARAWGRARRGLALAALCAGLLAALPARAAAQATRADTAAVLLRVAERLEAEGRNEQAAMLLTLILDRYGGTPAAVEARGRLQAAREAGRARPESGGRAELMVWGTLYGLWLGGAVPGAAGAESAEAYGIGLLVGGPVGFLLSRARAARGLTEGRARAITFGGTWGTWQGAGWREVADVGDMPEAALQAAVLGGLAGIGIGAALAGDSRITAGTATMVNFGALWGTWYGFGTAFVLYPEDEVETEDDRTLAMTLVGGNLGLIATALLAPRWDLSRPRARLINVAGVAGLVAGFGLLLLIEPSGDNEWMLVPMATSAAGLLAGAAWTRNYDRTTGRSESGDGAGGALLRLEGGRWSAGEPMPVPVLLDAAAGRRVPGLRLELLSVRF